MHSRLPPGSAWQALADHYEQMRDVRMRDLFQADPDRGRRYTIETAGIYLDYSKNLITDETLVLLLTLADESKLAGAVEGLFGGAIVNTSERRPALHTALRAGSGAGETAPAGEVMDLVQAELQRLHSLEAAVLDGRLKGFDEQPLDTIVNIGIGGSDLGPRLAADAFRSDDSRAPAVRFIAGIDPVESLHILSDLDPRRTLFIVSSKSFTTLETLHNARIARGWLQLAGCPDDAVSRHFFAATANRAAALGFGISEDHILNVWDWVGGRYSLWSAAGASAALAMGMDNYRRVLAGAQMIDRHFLQTPFDGNIPVILGLLGVWYHNLFDACARAVLPYDQRLRLLPDYLCQLIMESNGKSTTVEGGPVAWHTAPIVTGGIGTNVQHAFMQSLHQGTRLVPVDFLVAQQDEYDPEDGHAAMYANCLAQARALMAGGSDADRNPHAACPGNRPSNMLVYESLTPEALGAVLAIYEHVTFVQAHLWRINPFDQWGVELGKSMAADIMTELTGSGSLEGDDHDSSTAELIRRYREGSVSREDAKDE